VSMPYAFPWPDGPYPLIGYICTGCAGGLPSPAAAARVFGTDWLDPLPCSRCGRPVIHDIRRKLPKYIVCSEECQRAVYKARNLAIRNTGKKPCRFCGRAFQPSKGTALYCSGICKDRAYRQRRDTAQS